MAQPTYLPLWAADDTTLPATGETNKVRPREVLRTTGWDMGQIPTCEEWNWMFNNVYLWIEYLSGIYADATNLATPNTLALRDSSGGIDFVDISAETLELTGTATLPSAKVSGGSVDGTSIGSTIPSSGSFTTLSATGATTLEGDIKSSGENTFSGTGSFTGENTFSGKTILDEVDITSGSMDGTSVGGTTPSSGSFTTLRASGDTAFSGSITSTGTNSFSGTNTFSTQLNLQSSNISSNGYSYLPNGLIMQWGKVTVGTSSSTNVGVSVTFPVSFPNGTFSTTANTTTRYFNSSDGYIAVCSCVDQSQSGFTLYIDSDNAVSLTVEQVVNWIAIGH